MFKLPVCPYCHTVYSYGEVKKSEKKEIIKCYHCKNNFKQGRAKGFLFLAFIIVALAVLINKAILNLTADIVTSLIPLLAISLIAVILFIILSPYFIEFKKIKNEKIKEIPSVKITDDIKLKQKRSIKKRNNE
ncbi:MAG: hypothetical protein J1E41_03675 [Ruminococcus sp.]|nr:hypothetical protein [Ruminococcus sp.]